MVYPDRDLIFSANGGELMRNWRVRGIASVQLLVSLGAERGVLASDCLRGSAIAVDSLEDPFFEVEASQELTVVRNLLHHLAHVPGIGLEAGRRYRLTGYGILGYALLSSGSLRSAIDFAVRYLDLTFAFNRYQTEKLAEGLRIVLDDRDVPEDCRQFLVERDAAATVALSRQLLLKPFPLHRATFRFERPSYAARFKEFFLGPVFFGGPVHEMVISNEWVDQPLPQADERTARLCEEQCRELLDRRRVRARMSERVRQHLLRPRGAAQMEGLAAELGMAPRTLHRHLAAEGTSFRQLLDEVRQALAEEMLAHRMTVDEVAERLGYSEASSFAHAFKRWKGISPRTYRGQTADASRPRPPFSTSS
jgi:AraC-like DNA-binding protein